MWANAPPTTTDGKVPVAAPKTWLLRSGWQLGGGKGPAVIRVEAPSVPFLSLLDVLWPIVGMPKLWMTTDYIVEPGVPWLTLQTTATVGASYVIGITASYWMFDRIAGFAG